MSQIGKIKQRNPIGDRLFEDQLNPANQKFFPFYVFTNFEVRKDDPIYCDYCGEELTGNGSYECAYFVFQQSGEIKICCNVNRCMKGTHVWDYQEQIHGQPIPIAIGETAPLSWQMVFDQFVGRMYARYEIMKYSRITFEIFKKVCHPSEYSGGSFKKGWISYNGGKLIYTTDFTEETGSGCVLTLTNAEIVSIINEMLCSMRFIQLKLF